MQRCDAESTHLKSVEERSSVIDREPVDKAPIDREPLGVIAYGRLK